MRPRRASRSPAGGAALIAALAAAGLLVSPRAIAQKAQPPVDPGDHPAKEADPPLIPPPPRMPDVPPTSAAGTDLTPTMPPPSRPVAVSAVDEQAEARQDAKMRELEARIGADEKRLRKIEERQRALRWLSLGAFVQPQLLVQSYDAAASPNAIGGNLPVGIEPNDIIARGDGTTTNGTFFRMRRTRLRTTFEKDAARLYVEIDPIPPSGVGYGYGTVVRDAEATGTARWHRDVRTELGAGIFMPPTRLELRERSDVRPFIERSWASQNVFPAERDIGVHARTVALGERLVFDLGIVNGQRLGEPRFVAQPDLSRSKDLFAHLRYRLGPLGLGISGYVGRGQVVDAQRVRFKEFPRWWVNYEVSAHQPLVRALGETRVVAELAIARNMDTGINYPFAVPAIPANLSDDVVGVDQRSLSVRVEQDLTRWGQVGYRYDLYAADAAIKNNARDTHAFVAVARLSPNLRWMNELDYAIDNVHAAGLPAPGEHLFVFSSVLQAGF